MLNNLKNGQTGRFLFSQLTHTAITLSVLALLLVGARQVGALNRVLAPAAQDAGSSATTINYQGRLSDESGTPLDGQYDLKFAIYDAAEGGAMIWPTDGEPELHEDVTVSDGLFSVGLGSRTTGGVPTNVWSGDRYLQVWVESEELAPRELLRSVPVAGMALTVPDGAITDEKLAHSVSNVVLFNEPPYPLFEIPATTNDGSWHAIDLTSRVPSDATGVILQLGISASDGATLHVAPYGHEQIDYLSANTNGAWTFHQGMVSLVDGKISYKTGTSTDNLWIRLIGYIE